MHLKLKKVLLCVFVLIILSSLACEKKDGNHSRLEIICFNVGKADAFLFKTNEGTVLIDTGYKKSGEEIISYLNDNRIERIDYLIITHFDKDHVGGADSIIRNVEVKQVIQPEYEKKSKYFTQYKDALHDKNITCKKLKHDFYFSIGDVNYRINPPRQENYEKKQSNNSSLIVSISYGQTNFLFTGDAEDERLREYISQDSSNYSFLKVPYHGHYQLSLTEFLECVHPKYAVITSSGDQLEDEETVDILEKLECEIYYTRKGTITLKCDGQNIQINQ